MSSYTGRQPVSVRQYQTETATEAQTVFTLQANPVNNSVMVFVETLFQRPTKHYTISGTTLTFASGLTAGDKVDIYYDYVV
jgi:hypothetical protein